MTELVIWVSQELHGGGGHQALQAGWLRLELIVTQPLGEQPLFFGYLWSEHFKGLVWNKKKFTIMFLIHFEMFWDNSFLICRASRL